MGNYFFDIQYVVRTPFEICNFLKNYTRRKHYKKNIPAQLGNLAIGIISIISTWTQARRARFTSKLYNFCYNCYYYYVVLISLLYFNKSVQFFP